jgi:hypothetical protein
MKYGSCLFNQNKPKHWQYHTLLKLHFGQYCKRLQYDNREKLSAKLAPIDYI